MMPVGLVALCYHKVGTEAEEGRRLNIHPDRLESHIRFFKRRSFEFRRARDVGQSFQRERVVCFTFDDGFKSTLENGGPVFARQEVPVTVYAVSGLVGKESEWEAELARPLASWSELAEFQEQGHEVGNHTASHPRLGDLPYEEQLREIQTCHEALVSHGIRSESFCYPYGSLNDEARKAVTMAGYKIGMALGKRLPHGDPSDAIPRIVVAYGDALPILIYKLYIRPKLRRNRV